VTALSAHVAAPQPETRCPSVHYWSGMHCQHNAGHAGCCVADVWVDKPWISNGQRHVFLWWAAEPRCNQRDANATDYVEAIS